MFVQDAGIPDHYRELEVDPSASAETIRAAYSALAKRFHPDVNPDLDAAERMQRVNEAYEILRNEPKRRLYDLQRARSFDGHRDASAGKTSGSGSRTQRHAGTDAGKRENEQETDGGHTGASGQHGLRLKPIGYLLLGIFGVAVMALTLLLLGVLPPKSSNGSIARPTAVRGAKPATVPIGSGTSVAAPQRPALQRAADVIARLAERFTTLDRVTDERDRLTTADAAWRITVGGCVVFSGEYNTQEGRDRAKQYWLQHSTEPEISGNIIVSVSECDTLTHQTQVLEQVRDIMQHP